MKKSLLASSLVAAIALSACNQKAEERPAEVKLDSNLSKVSYFIGHNMTAGAKSQGIDLDMSALEKGIKDGVDGKELAVPQEELMTAMREFQKEQMEKRMSEQKNAEGKNKEEGAKYLEENAKKEGVTVTESGLQYKVVTASGSGQKPSETDTVVVHYKGTLINGEEFDSSYSRNQPATFPVNRVIKGWTEMLQLMDVGDKVEAVIPSELAYGPGGTQGKIGPHATLIFEIELLEIAGQEKPEAAAEEAPAEAQAEVTEEKADEAK